MQKLATGLRRARTQQSIERLDQGHPVRAGHIDGFESLIKARAKAQYPHLASQIDGGMTVRDIADPYIASYAQTLEVPETRSP
jgi:hypothetical protein